MPPRPSFWRISYLPSLRLAGAIIVSCPRMPAGEMAAAVRDGGRAGARHQKEVPRLHSVHAISAGSSSTVLVEDVADQRRPGALARRQRRALVALKASCGRSRGGRPDDQDALGGCNRGSRWRAGRRCAGPRISMPVPAPDISTSSTSTSESFSTIPAESGICSSARMQEAADARAVRRLGEDRRAGGHRARRAGWLPRDSRLRRVTPLLQVDLLAVLAAEHFHGVAGARLGQRFGDGRVLRSPWPTVSTRGRDDRLRRHPQAAENQAAAPATSEAGHEKRRDQPAAAKPAGLWRPGNRRRRSGSGAVNCSPSTTTTVTLSLPPARLAASISSFTAASGSPAWRSTRGRISAEGTWSLRPSLHSSSALSGSKGMRGTSMKSGSSGACSSEPDVAEDLVAARMAHGLRFAQFAGCPRARRRANGRG